ncbi:MAG: DnaA ATPase domain-containing protein, partial [Limimaricola sp.]
MTNETWQQVSEELKQAVGANNHTTWIAPLRFEELVDGVARFHVPTTFHGNYVLQNFGDQILTQLARAGITVQRLIFAQSANLAAAPRPAAAVPQPSVPAQAAAEDDDDTHSATLDPRFTFDRFVVGKPNEMAHAAARRIAEGGSLGFNPLFLYGGVGLGKTHLMHAIGHELKASQPHLKVVLTSAEQF